MGFLKWLGSLFSGGSRDKRGLYYYVRCDNCGEIIQVRLDRYNDLSLDFDTGGYFARKIVVGTRCYNRMEATFSFDGERNLKEKTVKGGTFVTREEYEQTTAGS